jgi:hypothetical protein
VEMKLYLSVKWWNSRATSIICHNFTPSGKLSSDSKRFVVIFAMKIAQFPQYNQFSAKFAIFQHVGFSRDI